MTLPLAIDRALIDPALFGFEVETWLTWIAVIKAAFGGALNRQERRAFEAVAGGRGSPTKRVKELWAIVGRRGGKSRVAAALAVYLACLGERPRLAPGETPMVLVLSASREQAGVVFAYARGFLEASPVLRAEIDAITNDEIRLRNGVVIGVHANSFRTVRGRTLLACIFDETAFWRSEETANPDIEVYRAVKPSLLTTKGMIFGIGSPYARRGLLYERHKNFYGKDDPRILVVQGPSEIFNPALAGDEEIAEARLADPLAASAEYDAQFRSDREAYVSQETLESSTVPGRRELPPMVEVLYIAFTDAAGGGGQDSFSLAIAHVEQEGDVEVAVLDLVREIRPPFSPEDAVAEFSALLRQYRLQEVTGDRYGGDFVREAFQRNGIAYKPAEKAKSDIYREFLPLINSGRVELLDNPRLVTQFANLERRTARGGKDSIDHQQNAHDDLCNAAAGALTLAAGIGGEDDGVRLYLKAFSPNNPHLHAFMGRL